jgi:hypothetical protein
VSTSHGCELSQTARLTRPCRLRSDFQPSQTNYCSKVEVELEYLRAYATTLGCWVAGLLGLGKKTDLACRKMKVGRIRLVACHAVVVASVPTTSVPFNQRREMKQIADVWLSACCGPETMPGSSSYLHVKLQPGQELPSITVQYMPEDSAEHEAAIPRTWTDQGDPAPG